MWTEIRSKLLLKLNKTGRLIMQVSLTKFCSTFYVNLWLNRLLTKLFFSTQALLAEGRFYSDLELTEKEIERMVMEASRAEYIADKMFKPRLGRKESSTSGAEPSSSGASK